MNIPKKGSPEDVVRACQPTAEELKSFKAILSRYVAVAFDLDLDAKKKDEVRRDVWLNASENHRRQMFAYFISKLLYDWTLASAKEPSKGYEIQTGFTYNPEQSLAEELVFALGMAVGTLNIDAKEFPQAYGEIACKFSDWPCLMNARESGGKDREDMLALLKSLKVGEDHSRRNLKKLDKRHGDAVRKNYEFFKFVQSGKSIKGLDAEREAKIKELPPLSREEVVVQQWYDLEWEIFYQGGYINNFVNHPDLQDAIDRTLDQKPGKQRDDVRAKLWNKWMSLAKGVDKKTQSED